MISILFEAGYFGMVYFNLSIFNYELAFSISLKHLGITILRKKNNKWNELYYFNYYGKNKK